MQQDAEACLGLRWRIELSPFELAFLGYLSVLPWLGYQVDPWQKPLRLHSWDPDYYFASVEAQGPLKPLVTNNRRHKP